MSTGNQRMIVHGTSKLETIRCSICGPVDIIYPEGEDPKTGWVRVGNQLLCPICHKIFEKMI